MKTTFINYQKVFCSTLFFIQTILLTSIGFCNDRAEIENFYLEGTNPVKTIDGKDFILSLNFGESDLSLKKNLIIMSSNPKSINIKSISSPSPITFNEFNKINVNGTEALKVTLNVERPSAKFRPGLVYIKIEDTSGKKYDFSFYINVNLEPKLYPLDEASKIKIKLGDFNDFVTLGNVENAFNIKSISAWKFPNSNAGIEIQDLYIQIKDLEVIDNSKIKFRIKILDLTYLNDNEIFLIINSRNTPSESQTNYSFTYKSLKLSQIFKQETFLVNLHWENDKLEHVTKFISDPDKDQKFKVTAVFGNKVDPPSLEFDNNKNIKPEPLTDMSNDPTKSKYIYWITLPKGLVSEKSYILNFYNNVPEFSIAKDFIYLNKLNAPIKNSISTFVEILPYGDNSIKKSPIHYLNLQESTGYMSDVTEIVLLFHNNFDFGSQWYKFTCSLIDENFNLIELQDSYSKEISKSQNPTKVYIKLKGKNGRNYEIKKWNRFNITITPIFTRYSFIPKDEENYIWNYSILYTDGKTKKSFSATISPFNANYVFVKDSIQYSFLNFGLNHIWKNVSDKTGEIESGPHFGTGIFISSIDKIGLNDWSISAVGSIFWYLDENREFPFGISTGFGFNFGLHKPYFQIPLVINIKTTF